MNTFVGHTLWVSSVCVEAEYLYTVAVLVVRSAYCWGITRFCVLLATLYTLVVAVHYPLLCAPCCPLLFITDVLLTAVLTTDIC